MDDQPYDDTVPASDRTRRRRDDGEHAHDTDGPHAHDTDGLVADVVSLVSRWELGASHRLRARADHAGLTVRELLTLSELAVRPDGLSNAQISGILGVRPSTVAGDLAALRARRLMKRSRHPSDGRQIVSTVTRAGRTLVDQERWRSDRALSAAVREAGQENLRVLVRFLGMATDLAYAESRNIRQPLFLP